MRKSLPVLLRIETVRFPNRAVVRDPITRRKYEIKNVRLGQTVLCRFRGGAAKCRVIAPASDEGDLFCPHGDECGGCYYPRYSAELQLRRKADTAAEILGLPIGQVIASPRAEQYRNKMEYSFGDRVKGGEMTLGMHAAGRHHDVVSVPGCRLVHPDFERIRSAVLDYARNSGLPLYRKSGDKSGFFRHLIVRRSEANGEMLVALSAASDSDFDRSAFCGAVLNSRTEGRIAGILYIRNDGVADVSAGEAELLYGEDRIRERVLGVEFQLSVGDFFQTNTRCAELLYDRALSRLIEESDFGREDLLLDLFCGTGTIGQLAAKRIPGLRVAGVDIVESAVESARRNAERNGIDAMFVAGDVFEILKNREWTPSHIVVDPPRCGIGRRAVQKIASYDVETILYISCNPVTLARDLECFADCSYRADRVDLCDMFPMTSGLECIVLLRRVRAENTVF